MMRLKIHNKSQYDFVINYIENVIHVPHPWMKIGLPLNICVRTDLTVKITPHNKDSIITHNIPRDLLEFMYGLVKLFRIEIVENMLKSGDIIVLDSQFLKIMRGWPNMAFRNLSINSPFWANLKADKWRFPTKKELENLRHI